MTKPEPERFCEVCKALLSKAETQVCVIHRYDGKFKGAKFSADDKPTPKKFFKGLDDEDKKEDEK